MKGTDDRLQSMISGAFNQAAKQGSMSQVDAIEVSQGNNAGSKISGYGGKRIDANHKRRYPLENQQ